MYKNVEKQRESENALLEGIQQTKFTLHYHESYSILILWYTFL